MKPALSVHRPERRHRLTARDRSILRAVGRMGQATAEQLRRLFFGRDVSTVLRRLRKLEELRLLKRHVTNVNEPNIYTLSGAGYTLLIAGGAALAELHRAKVGRHRDLHLELLNDVRVEFVLAARQGCGLELVAFHGDLDLRRVAGSPPPAYIPDGIAELRTLAGDLVLMIEVDTGSEGAGVFASKVAVTVELWQTRATCWGARPGSWRPVVFVPDGARARTLARAIVSKHGGALWLVAEVDRLRAVGALGPIFATAGDIAACPVDRPLPYQGALTGAPTGALTPADAGARP